jgi:hypothetical protein
MATNDALGVSPLLCWTAKALPKALIGVPAPLEWQRLQEALVPDVEPGYAVLNAV